MTTGVRRGAMLDGAREHRARCGTFRLCGTAEREYPGLVESGIRRLALARRCASGNREAPGRKGAFILTLLAITMGAATTPSAAQARAFCEVGRAALRDLPSADTSGRSDSFYAASDTNRRDLLVICPDLQGGLPPGYRIADDDARRRAAVHAPLPGVTTRPAFIYIAQVSQMSADLRAATIRFSYECTGLCGGEFEAHYICTAEGWRRQGAVRILSVS